MGALSFIFLSYPAKFLGCAVMFFVSMFLLKGVLSNVLAKSESKNVVVKLVRSTGGFYFQFLLFAFYLIASPVVLSQLDSFECTDVCRQILKIGLPRKANIDHADPLVPHNTEYVTACIAISIVTLIIYIRVFAKPVVSLESIDSSHANFRKFYFQPKTSEVKTTAFNKFILLTSGPGCKQDNVRVPFCGHSAFGERCVCYYDHTCPWVGTDVCADNLIRFWIFVSVGSVQSGMILIYSIVRIFHQVMYVKSLLDQPLSLGYVVPAAIVSGNAPVYVAFLISFMASIMLWM